MAQQIELLPRKPNDLSLVSRIQIKVEGENQPDRGVLTPTCTLTDTSYAHTH